MIELFHGDCLEVMRTWPENSVDSFVTDPPYELGFMGKKWDASGIAFNIEMWAEALRVLKPGGHLLSFGGTRTYHRMGCAIEDAGFLIRDSLHWFYGTGFPKSLNIAKELSPPHSEQWEGWGTALKPGHEPIVMAMKTLAGTFASNVVRYGTGALNIDGCRIATTENLNGGAYALDSAGRHDGTENWRFKAGGAGGYVQPDGRWPANVLLDEDAAAELDAQTADLRVGGALNGGEGGARAQLGPRGPWESYGDKGGASRFFYVAKPGRSERDAGCEHLPLHSAGATVDREDGSAGLNSPRAGAGRTSGARNTHPTVKPIALMRYLCRLVTPPGGVVVDPFCGSGTTGIAAHKEGFDFVGIDKEFSHLVIANARITHHQGVTE